MTASVLLKQPGNKSCNKAFYELLAACFKLVPTTGQQLVNRLVTTGSLLKRMRFYVISTYMQTLFCINLLFTLLG